MKKDAGLKPVNDFRVYRRNLPHMELPGSFYFITFRTREDFNLSDTAKDIVLSSFRFHDRNKYVLHACIVMNTHVHCILQPLEKSDQELTGKMPVTPGTFYSLAQIMHSIKSYSAKQIQKLMSIKSNIWLDENYDRIIRDEAEYTEKMNYIIHNPVKAGIAENPENYKWLYVQDKV